MLGVSVLPQSLWVLGATFLLLALLYLLPTELFWERRWKQVPPILWVLILWESQETDGLLAFGVSAGTGSHCRNSDHARFLHQLQF